MPLTRRTLLVAGSGATSAAAALGCGTRRWSLERGRLESPYAVGGSAGWFLARPRGTEAAPLVVLLHGTGQSAAQVLRDRDPVRVAQEAGARLTFAGIDGADTYWHPRDDGTDTGALVLDALLPQVAAAGVDVGRPAWLGWSMGGFGALLLAARREQRGERTGPVLMSSPALWGSYAAARRDYPEAFDSAADWRDQMALLDRPVGATVRVETGERDQFALAVEQWAAGREVDVRTYPGAHTSQFSAARLPAQLRWLARQM